MGDTIFNDGSTLNLTTTAGVNGKAIRIGGTTFGTGVTLNGAGDGTYGADLYIDGVLNDGGTAKTIAKTGKGRLVLSQSRPLPTASWPAPRSTSKRARCT